MVLRRCSICDRNFTKHFLRHQRSHTKERPYECVTCKKRFSRSDVLFRHSKLHSQQPGDEKPRRQSIVEGQQSRPEPSIPSSGDRKGTPNGQFEQTLDHSTISPSPYGGSHIDQLGHMSMSNISIGHMQYEMSTPQQTPVAHVATAQIYSGPDYSQDFPGSMNGQVYDPQLVAMDPQTAQNDVMQKPFRHSSSIGSLAGHSADMLQFWLSQADDSFGYAAVSFPDSPENMHNAVDESTAMRPPPRPATASEVSDATSTSNIPNERFARVEACWRSDSDGMQRLGPTLWDDVMLSPGPNLFTLSGKASIPPALNESDSRWGIGAELKQRLELEFGMSAIHASSDSGNDSFPMPRNLGVPPPEVLDICLDAYFRRFHPLAPFVHVPTFNANACPLPLLYAMCLIGLSAVKENVGGKYMKHAFRNILRRVMRDLAVEATTDIPVGRRLSTYAAGCLTLNLAALSGDQGQVADAQALHASLLSGAQKQGLFSVNEVRLHRSFATSGREIERWHGWARMETVKRLIVCLLINDWWFSASSSSSPTVRAEAIQICIPSDNALFKAESVERWTQCLESGKYKLTFPLLRPRTFNLQGSLDSLICLDPPLHAFGQYALLSIIKHLQCDIQQRQFPTPEDWDQRDHLIPWRSFFEDTRGRSLVSVIVGLASIITATPRTTDLNALVLWHNICMTMNANVHIMELAAGRHGAAPASKALAEIAEWRQTPSARRACIHAAHIYKLLHHRKVSDPISINALTGLFHAGLVLGLYLFASSPDDGINGSVTYDLLDHVDWIMVGDAGMAEDDTPANSPGAVFDGAKSSIPAVTFIEHGGYMSVGGAITSGGYTSARRTFLDFAHLMDEMGTWKQRALSKILHIMSDVLEDPN